MDKITHEVRLRKWESIIEACNSRPQGMSARKWLEEQKIPPKTYYYWQRRIRQEVYNQMQQTSSPQTSEEVAVTFAEQISTDKSDPMPDESLSFHADAVIQTDGVTIEFSNQTSQSLIRKILESVRHVS